MTQIGTQYKKWSKIDNLSESYTPKGYGGLGLASTSKNVKKTQQSRILTSDEARQTVHNKTGIKTERDVTKHFNNLTFSLNISSGFQQPYVRVAAQKAISENKNNKQEKTLYDKFEESGLIGFCSVEEDLSTTYKQVLSDTLNAKYDHR